MTTTINAIDSSTASLRTLAYTDAPALIDRVSVVAPETRPSTLVLQPRESLNYTNSRAFQSLLEDTLEQVTEAVIIDLLWVDSTDADGIAALVAGIQRAAALGKLLSFQAMAVDSRLALEDAWAHQQEMSSGPWSHTFSSKLDAFLDAFTHGRV